MGSDVALEPAGSGSLDGEGVYALSDSGGPGFGDTHKSGSITSSMFILKIKRVSCGHFKARRLKPVWGFEFTCTCKGFAFPCRRSAHRTSSVISFARCDFV